MLTELRLIAAMLALALAAGLSAAAPAAAQADCRDTIEGRICSVQQPLVGGTLVPTDLQRELGLVAVGGCSGTLLNRYWVLTADHCVAADGAIAGPNPDPNTIMVTATWSTATPRATNLVRFAASNGLDIALIFLGAGDFGPANLQLLFGGEVDPGMTMTKYGRGISSFASGSGASAMPANSDGAYRSSRFLVSEADRNGYTLPMNAAGAVGHGGDSGAADVVTAPNGVGLGIAGVQSTCLPSGYVSGQPENWRWATGVDSCQSAAIGPVRFEILQAIQEMPGQFIGRFGTTPPNYQPIWLYAAKNDGTLQWYRLDTSGSPWQGPRQIGIGWQFRDLIPAGGNVFYALTFDGKLLWYRHDGFNDGSFSWAGPVEVGSGWIFAKVFSGSDGVVYAVQSDGTLLWYRNAGFIDGTANWSGPRTVGSGWAGFKNVFSAGDGIIYAVTQSGDLMWYRHDGYLTGDASWSGPYQVGTGWASFRDLVPSGDGVILAITDNGDLLWYRHDDYRVGRTFESPTVARPHWQGPIAIGTGWTGFRQVTALLPRTPTPP